MVSSINCAIVFVNFFNMHVTIKIIKQKQFEFEICQTSIASKSLSLERLFRIDLLY